KGCVRICIPVVWRRDKQVTGYLPQCCKNARVPDAPCRDLEIHHPAAFVRSRVRDGHVPFKFLKSCFLCHVNGGIDLLLECLGKAGDLDVEETPMNVAVASSSESPRAIRYSISSCASFPTAASWESSVPTTLPSISGIA